MSKIKNSLKLLIFTLVFIVGFFVVQNVVRAQTTWYQVGTTGFDVDGAEAASLCSFNGNLYAGVTDWVSGTRVMIYSGGSWSQVNTSGFGDTANASVTSLTVHGGNLYAGTYNYSVGAQVWRYDGGTSWTKINTDAFGDSNNERITSMISSGGENLYAATLNSTTGTEVWAYNGSWSQINTNGFGTWMNLNTPSLVIFNDNLIASTYKWSFAGGSEVWSYNGSTWSQINTDGFGVAANEGSVLEVYNGNLYAATENNTNDTAVWIKEDGTNWTKMSTDGFGDTNNSITNDLEASDDFLYAITTNYTTGLEVWLYDGIGWIHDTDGQEGFGSSSRPVGYSLETNGDYVYAGTFLNAGEDGGGEVWRNGPLDDDDDAIPEMGTWAMIIASMLGLGGYLFFRQRKNQEVRLEKL